MRILLSALAALALSSVVSAQPALEPPLDDARLGVHTLVREDIFAGILYGDATRFARGEANIQKLLASRPRDRAALLAWQAGGEVHRAVAAREAGKAAEYKRLLAEATRHWDEAEALKSRDPGVPATIGGVILIFGDRLAPEDRKPAWDRAYHAYQALYDEQGPGLDKMPSHLRGEVIGGLVQSAQRSGRKAEYAMGLERMLVLVKGTPYEAAAQQWKADPAAAGKTTLVCKHCHDENRLAPTLARLNKPRS